MKLFIILYASLELIFHSIGILLDDNRKGKKETMYALGAIIIILDMIMFHVFNQKLLHFFRIYDESKFNKTGVPVSKVIKFLRRSFLNLWFVIYTMDVLFMAYMRPAGSLVFLGESI